MKRLLLLLALAAVLLSACLHSGRTASSPISPSSPPARKTASRATPTIPPAFTRPDLPTSTPSLTPGPIEATWDSLTRETYASGQTLTRAAAAALGGFPGGCRERWSTLLSPDGQWLAGDCHVDEIFTVSRRDGSRSWKITYPEAVTADGDPVIFALVDALLPVQWSSDSRFVYFVIRFCCFDGMGDWGSYDMHWQEWSLFRLDTNSGFWMRIFDRSSDYYFSPTGQSLLAVRRDRYSIDLLILDLQTMVTVRQTLPDTLAAGCIVWSGDGRKFYFSTVHHPSDPSWYMADSVTYIYDYSVFSLEIDGPTIAELQSYPASRPTICPVGLLDDTKLVVQLEKYTREDPQTEYRHITEYSLLELAPTP